MALHVLDPANYTVNLFSAPPAIIAAAVLLLGILVLFRERASLLSISFLTITLVVGIWLFSLSWVYAAQEPAVALWWSRAAYLGVPFIGTAAYQFAVAVLRMYPTHKWGVWLAWVASGMFAVLGLTTPMLISRVERYPWGYYGQYSWLGMPFLAFTFGMLMLSMARFWKAYVSEQSPIRKMRVRWMMFAYAIGYAASVDFLAACGVPVYPFGYVGIAGFVIVSALAVWRYHLVDITPLFAAGTVLDTMNDALLVIDTEGLVQLANPVARRFFDIAREAPLGRALGSVAQNQTLLTQFAPLFSLDRTAVCETEYLTSEGATCYLDLTSSLLLDPRGSIAGTSFLIRDITKRKVAEAQLQHLNADLERRITERTSQLATANRELEIEVHERRRLTDDLSKSRDQLDIILRGVADGILVQDQTGDVIYANDAALGDLGFVSLEALQQTPASQVLVQFDLLTEDGEICAEEMLPGRLALNNLAAPERVLCFRRRDSGEERWSIVTATSVFDRAGNVQFAVSIFKDITARKLVEKALKDLSVRDELTGLYNRRELNRLLLDEADRYSRYKRPAALIMLDIDHFKSVNDTYGHQVGDLVLKQVAGILGNNIRSTDRLARYGGEEFALILPETTLVSAFDVAEDLRQRIADCTIAVEGTDGVPVLLTLTASLGVSSLSPLHHSPDLLLLAADRALYLSKHAGRNCTSKASEAPQPAPVELSDGCADSMWAGGLFN